MVLLTKMSRSWRRDINYAISVRYKIYLYSFLQANRNCFQLNIYDIFYYVFKSYAISSFNIVILIKKKKKYYFVTLFRKIVSFDRGNMYTVYEIYATTRRELKVDLGQTEM